MAVSPDLSVKVPSTIRSQVPQGLASWFQQSAALKALFLWAHIGLWWIYLRVCQSRNEEVNGKSIVLSATDPLGWLITPKGLGEEALAWSLSTARVGDYPMPPADKPLVAMLRDLL